MKFKYWRLVLSCVFGFSILSCSLFEGSKNNVKENGFFYVRSDAGFQEILDSLQPKLKDLNSFESYAKSENYPENIKAGKYKLVEGETNKDLVHRLITGAQEEVSLRIKNEPTIFHLAGSVSKKIEADSTQIVQAILDWAKEKDPNLNAETVKMYFIPNTYNYYWPTNGNRFVEKMIIEFDKVWNENRQQKAKEKNLSTLQVFTLASIVQMEASKADEQPKVAQAYLNRLAKGMKLEADPTAIYAYKMQKGFENVIQRVKYGHLATPSEYNTYRVKGLPPAPICLPNVTAVDAVLNPENHSFIYFCADPDRPGYHSFTNSFEEHKKNAAKYRKWLESRNIK